MALPQTPEMAAYVAKALKAHIAQQEATVRALLSQWVSGLEPVIVRTYDCSIDQIKGIGIADDPTGMIVVANPKWRKPFEFIRQFGQMR